MREKLKPYIICIDDERIILNSLIDQLKTYFGDELIVEAVESGEEALEVMDEYMEEHHQSPHLIISDQVMPNMTGDEVLFQATKRYPKAKKILLTGQAKKDDLVKIINSTSLYRYIEKPWDNVDLNLTVEEALKAYNGERMVEKQQKELISLNKFLEQKVEQRTQELKEKNEELMAGIRYAKRIQEGILPGSEILKENFKESFLLHRPLDMLSGDFFWFAKVDDVIIMSVIDCTGHGVPGALMSMVGNTLLSEIIIINKNTDPGEILNQLNTGVIRILNQENSGLKDGMDMSLACVDLANNELKFAGAVNPLYFIESGQLKILDGHRTSIGDVYVESNPYRTQTLNLENVDMVYMSSDGYFDQFGGEKDLKFSSKRFRGLLQGIWEQPMEDQKRELNKQFDFWKNENPQVDDIMVLGVKLR